MILIISNPYDVSTNKVIRFFLSKKNVYRYNSEKDIFRENKQLSSIVPDSFWYRRGGLRILVPKIKLDDLAQFIEREYKEFGDYLFFSWKYSARYSLGDKAKEELDNRLIDQLVAKKNGLRVPKTYCRLLKIK